MVEMFPEMVLTRGKTQTRYPDGIRVLLTVKSAKAVAEQILDLVRGLGDE